MKEKKDLIQWIKDHRKALITAGVSIGLIIAIVFGIKNADTLKALWATLRKAVAKPAMKVTQSSAPVITSQATATVVRNSCTVPFDVSAHLRNLPKGHHASAAKAATALDNGFVLKEGQTWVEAFMKGKAA